MLSESYTGILYKERRKNRDKTGFTGEDCFFRKIKTACFIQAVFMIFNYDLFSVSNSPGFTDNGDFHLSRVSHFVLYALSNIK